MSEKTRKNSDSKVATQHPARSGLGDPPCSLCGGDGHYMYDENHGKICEQCCTHDQGWWELTEYHAGFVEGEDNRCCRAGCGMLYRDLKANAKDHTS
jgi:hypothetical protein